MLVLFALVASAYAQSAFSTLANGISMGTTTGDQIMTAAMTGVITMPEVASLIQMMQQAAAAAAAAGSASCDAQQSDARHQTPVNNGVLGYGDAQCANLPAAKFANPVVSDDVPDISGVYTIDGGRCPDNMSGGNMFRIEQDGDQLLITGARVQHHFMKEAEGCEAVLSDFKATCVGRTVADISPTCQTGKVVAVPDMANNCWNLRASFVTVSWCKTETGVSRAMNGNVVQTFTTFE